jgi:hypothetical protein
VILAAAPSGPGPARLNGLIGRTGTAPNRFERTPASPNCRERWAFTPRRVVTVGTPTDSAGIALWTETVADVEFEPHNLQVLAEACRTLDALHSLQDALDADGPIIDSPQGRKANRALPELRQGRIVLARLLAALKIPAADDGPIKTRAPRGVAPPCCAALFAD